LHKLIYIERPFLHQTDVWKTLTEGHIKIFFVIISGGVEPVRLPLNMALAALR